MAARQLFTLVVPARKAAESSAIKVQLLEARALLLTIVTAEMREVQSSRDEVGCRIDVFLCKSLRVIEKQGR